ncbi:MAG: hypothetical protein GX335_09800 [Firmicutes bacterium]|nr:hypothetical protein [Bacillota bacterium]
MLVDSERTLALVCPACQKIQKHTFSMFAVSEGPFSLLCPCGFSQGNLRRRQKNFIFNVFSAAGERVRLQLSLRQFATAPLTSIFSPQTGREIGFFGEHSAVSGALGKWAEKRSPADLGDVNNPEIMQEILETLQDLAGEHKIRCGCERPSVGIDVYADKVELVCSFCGSAVLIRASTRKHQERLSQVEEIVMEPSEFIFLEEWLKPIP